MRSNRWLTALMLMALLVSGSTATAQKKNKKNDGPPTAPLYVDFGRLIVAYRKTGAYAKVKSGFTTKANGLREEMEMLQLTRYLTPAELEDYQELSAKAKLSKQEEQRKETLAKRSEQMDLELRSLSVLTSPSPEQEARLATITTAVRAAEQRLRREAGRLDNEMNKLDAELRGSISEKLLQIIRRAARARKWPSVLERAAVLFGGTDVTEIVIEKLPL